MNANSGLYYGEYLQLDKILNAQDLESERVGNTPAHDEMLFIIVHQAYELWFKQIRHELDSVIQAFRDDVLDDKQMGYIVSRLGRVREIQLLLIAQIDVMETMTPLDFLEFRDLLVPASGFQSLQFKQIEVTLGLKRSMRIQADQEFFQSRLNEHDRSILEEYENRPSVLEVTEEWLARMPFIRFKDFDFWQTYSDAVDRMLNSDEQIILSHPNLSDREREFQLGDLQATRNRFAALLDEDKFAELKAQGEFRFSREAMLSAVFINLYRDEPMLQLPFRYLTRLVEIDEQFTNWRARHAIMVQRMLGSKIGTGGSSGHDYLSRTTQRNRVFVDLFNLSTYLIPRSSLPVLPSDLIRALGFQEAEQTGSI